MRRAMALWLAATASASAHRLDEYLQATLISVESRRMQAEIRLVPGVAVLPLVMAALDTDHDGHFSQAEQKAYSDGVIRDLSFTMDGVRLRLKLDSSTYPGLDELQAGLGQITLNVSAELPQSGRERRLVFENRHQRRIAAYLVNCLVPSDPNIRIEAQKRNYSQSLYELDYEQSGTRQPPWVGPAECLAAYALVLSARLVYMKRRRTA